MQFQIYVGLGIVGEKRWSWMKLPLWFLPSSIQCNSIYISLFEFTFHNVKWTYQNYKNQNCWTKTRNSNHYISSQACSCTKLKKLRSWFSSWVCIANCSFLCRMQQVKYIRKCNWLCKNIHHPHQFTSTGTSNHAFRRTNQGNLTSRGGQANLLQYYMGGVGLPRPPNCIT